MKNKKNKFSIFVAVVCFLSPGVLSAGDEASCAGVRRNFVSRQIGSTKLVPNYAIQTKSLRICSNAKPTCCNRKMERKYQKASNRDLIQILEEKTSTFKLHLTKFAEEYEADLTSLITRSRAETFSKLNSTFYDVINTQSLTGIIDSLYGNVVIAKDSVTLSEIVDQLQHSVLKFFESLFALVFQREGGIRLSIDQFKCVASQASILDFYNSCSELIRNKLTKALSQTSVQIRALESGIRAMSISTKSYISKECNEALVKMQYCSHCYGLTLIKPCKGLCENVMRGCLVGFSETDKYWQRYLKGLTNTLHNITEEHADLQSVFDELRSKLDRISQLVIPTPAINEVKGTCRIPISRHQMLADRQRASLSVKKKFPSLKYHMARLKIRHTQISLNDHSSLPKGFIGVERNPLPPHLMLTGESPMPIKVERRHEPNDGEEIMRRPHHDTEDLNLNAKLQRFISLLNFSSSFFSNLPDDVCSSDDDYLFPVSPVSNCWDGAKIVNSYNLPIPEKGLEGQYNNPEVKVTGLNKEVKESIQNVRYGEKILYLDNGLSIFRNRDASITPTHSASTSQTSKQENSYPRVSSAPCGDDEDDCDDTGSTSSGDEADGNMHKPSNFDENAITRHPAMVGMKSAVEQGQRRRTKLATGAKDSNSVSGDIKEQTNELSPSGSKKLDGKSGNGRENSGNGILFQSVAWRTTMGIILLQSVLQLVCW